MKKALLFALLFSLSALPIKASGEEKTEAVILRLIQSVQKLPADTEFIRNSDSYNKDEAAAHLLSKYKRVRKNIATAEEFIEKIASKSSISGRDYLIKFSDNTTIKAGDFFKEELKKIENE
ncbi:MAG: DUF5329 domain-containing protein [Deferribacteraceae bacterium]|nr:DUF5329 domain-containing protein [Deferribacteraceae bacterium]